MTWDEIQRRWQEIDDELAVIAVGEVTIEAVLREGELLEEQDQLEFEAGTLYFAERDRKILDSDSGCDSSSIDP